jgi:hypothetical protein
MMITVRAQTSLADQAAQVRVTGLAAGEQETLEVSSTDAKGVQPQGCMPSAATSNQAASPVTARPPCRAAKSAAARPVIQPS